jgi:hypothetical protein
VRRTQPPSRSGPLAWRILVPGVAFWLAGLALSAACDGQGEGQACDPANGNNDCQDGYECTSTLPPGTLGSRCCPGVRSLATTAICSQTGAAQPMAPTDASGQGAFSQTDGSADATTDAGTNPDATGDAAGNQVDADAGDSD